MKILVLGLGAIGSNVLTQLVKKYGTNHTYYGVDYDKVEERNIATQNYFIDHLGHPKAQAIQISLQRSQRRFGYQGINRKLNSTNDLFTVLTDNSFQLSNDIILDCFDNVEARKLVCDAECENTLHIGFSPQYTAEIIWQKDYSLPEAADPNNSDICVVSEALPFIGLVTNFATMIISNFIDRKIQESYIITNKFYIKKLS